MPVDVCTYTHGHIHTSCLNYDPQISKQQACMNGYVQDFVIVSKRVRWGVESKLGQVGARGMCGVFN